MSNAAEPVVSVCIQTYQHAAFIAQCIDSAVKQQTPFTFEIIIGEDDSTDGTREICKVYAAKHPELIRLFLRDEKDKLVINGEKTGRHNFIENIRAARGKYIALLDGDDYWCDPRKLAKQVAFMEEHKECSLSFHNGFRCIENGKPFIKPDDIRASIDTVFDPEFLIHSEHNPFLTSSSLFYRKNVQSVPAMFYEVPFLDLTLHIHNALAGKIGFLADKMVVYRLHTGGMWSGARAPVNSIRLWKLYSLLGKHTDERVRVVFAARRADVGSDLIAFYKKHLWMNRKWFETELLDGKFREDESLLLALNKPPGIRNYLSSMRYYVKDVTRKMIGRK